MGLLTDTVAKFVFAQPEQKSGSSGGAGVFGFMSPSAAPRMGEKGYLQAYKGWVYAATDVIASRVADVELKIQKKTANGWTDLTMHPALDLLHTPNPFMSGYDLMFSTAAYEELDGNAFWWLVRNGGGKIMEIWPLDPSKVTVVKASDPREFIAGYVFTNDLGEKVPLETDEVLHFKRFNPRDKYRGMGTVEAAAIPIDINEYASEWQRNFFGNSAMPSGALVAPYDPQTGRGGMTQEQYDRIRANWDAKFKGVGNAHKMAILEGGLTWVNLTPNAREMEFGQSRKDVRDEILAIFHVPKPIIGILEDINLASAQVAEYNFAKDVVRPKIKQAALKLSTSYLPYFGLNPAQYRLWFVDPVPENTEEKLLMIANGRQWGWLTANEAREQFGYEEREDADDLNMPQFQTDEPGTNAQDNPAQTAQDEAEEDEQENAKSVKKNITFKRLEITQKSQDDKATYIDAQQTALHVTYKDLNTKLEAQLLARLEQHKSVPQTLTRRLVAQIKKDAGEPNDELVRFLFDTYDDWVGLVYNATRDGLERVLDQSGKTTLAELNVDASFNLQNPRALDWLNTNALKDATSYSDSTKEALAIAIQEGVEFGQSTDEVAGAIRGFFTDQSDYRAERMARTEVINAYANGNLEGYRQSGVVGGKYWQPDANACPMCLGNAGDGVIPLDQAFSSGAMAPTAHPNCECSLGAAVDDNA